MILFLIPFYIASFITLPLVLLLPVPSGKIDALYALSKIIGPLLIGILCWWLTSTGVIYSDLTGIYITAGILVAISFSLNRISFHQLKLLVKDSLKVEYLFLSAFALFALTRFLQPEIFWGEKPMDSSFLNYFIRETKLPPTDPWASDFKMAYYYFGYYFFGLVHKVTGIDSGIGYNLAIAITGALFVTSLYATLRLLSVTSNFAFGGSFLIVCSSNLEWIKQLVQGKHLGFDMFWATSRVLTSPGINEYPWWSILFADLHPHLMVFPTIGGTIALAALIALRTPASISANLILLTLTGVFYGSIYLWNAWDLVATGFVLLGSFFIRFTRSIKIIFIDPWYKHLVKTFFEGIFVLLIAAITAAPAVFSSSARPSIGWNWCVDTEFNTIWMLLIHFGGFLLPILLAIFILFKRLEFSWLKFSTALIVAESPLIFVLISSFVYLSLVKHLPIDLIVQMISSYLQQTHPPMGIIGLCFFLIFIGTILLFKLDIVFNFTGILLITSGIVLSTAELIYVMDRMNTLFKFYNPCWTMLGIASVLLLNEAVGKYFKRFFNFNIFYNFKTTAINTFVLLIFSPLILGSILHLFSLATFNRAGGPRPTINGYAYLKDSKELKAYEFMKSIPGTPTTVEAFGDSYQNYTRFTMYTGLPTVLGWEYHVQQRGLDRDKIQQRKIDIEKIYNTTDFTEVKQTLRKYDVKYIIVGDLERKKYSGDGIRKFFDRSDIFPVAYHDEDTTIFKFD